MFVLVNISLHFRIFKIENSHSRSAVSRCVVWGPGQSPEENANNRRQRDSELWGLMTIWWCYDKGHENQFQNDQFSAQSIGCTTSPCPLSCELFLPPVWSFEYFVLFPNMYMWIWWQSDLFPHETSHNHEITTQTLHWKNWNCYSSRLSKRIT